MSETFETKVSVNKTGTSTTTVTLDADVGKISAGGHSSAGAMTFFPPDGFAWFHIDNGPAGGRPTGRLRVSHGNTPGAHELVSILQNGHVGVATTAPAVRFHVVGNRIRLESGGRRLDLRSDGAAVDIQSETHSVYLHSHGPSGRNHVIINPFGGEGNVGVGTGSPTDKLHVVGNVRANDFLVTSDKRLKTDIQPIRGALQTLLRLRGVEFAWREGDDTPSDDGSRRSVGVIAQEVEAVVPELVREPPNDGYKTVNLSGLLGTLIEAFKELAAENGALRGRVAALESAGSVGNVPVDA